MDFDQLPEFGVCLLASRAARTRIQNSPLKDGCPWPILYADPNLHQKIVRLYSDRIAEKLNVLFRDDFYGIFRRVIRYARREAKPRKTADRVGIKNFSLTPKDDNVSRILFLKSRYLGNTTGLNCFLKSHQPSSLKARMAPGWAFSSVSPATMISGLHVCQMPELSIILGPSLATSLTKA